MSGSKEFELHSLVPRQRFRPVLSFVASATVVTAGTTVACPATISTVAAVIIVTRGLLPAVVGRQRAVPVPTVTVTPVATAANKKDYIWWKTLSKIKLSKILKVCSIYW